MLENLTPPKRIYPCRVRTVKDQMELDDRIRLESALRDENWSAWALHKALQSRGVSITDKSIKRHRDGDCSCALLD